MTISEHIPGQGAREGVQFASRSKRPRQFLQRVSLGVIRSTIPSAIARKKDSPPVARYTPLWPLHLCSNSSPIQCETRADEMCGMEIVFMSCNMHAVTSASGIIVMERVREAGITHGLTPANCCNTTRASPV
ncbi:hypothetical protein IG631_06285 [Alternaria alternata]|nr:hypothetical protein IG631_06285 [Alternaria alternata]